MLISGLNTWKWNFWQKREIFWKKTIFFLNMPLIEHWHQKVAFFLTFCGTFLKKGSSKTWKCMVWPIKNGDFGNFFHNLSNYVTFYVYFYLFCWFFFTFSQIKGSKISRIYNFALNITVFFWPFFATFFWLFQWWFFGVRDFSNFPKKFVLNDTYWA